MTLLFLKLGGSLITDKTRPYTPRPERLADLASQIAAALRDDPDLKLVLGHGSGSFGHTAASQYDTRRGVTGPKAWHGFAEVWYQASALNRLVMDALHHAGIAAVAFPPSASVITRDGQVAAWNITSLQSALDNNLLPVIYGDVSFDTVRGGTILSTEDLFEHLAHNLHPQRILLAGLEVGIWADFPKRTHLVREVTPDTFSAEVPSLGGAVGADVTGGMESKARQMMRLVEQVPGLEILIFSGKEPDNIHRALRGESPGTRLRR